MDELSSVDSGRAPSLAASDDAVASDGDNGLDGDDDGVPQHVLPPLWVRDQPAQRKDAFLPAAVQRSQKRNKNNNNNKKKIKKEQ